MNSSVELTSSLWDDAVQPRAQQKKTGLRVLMLALGSLFFLFIVAFVTRAQLADYESLTAPWQPLAHPIQLWINTALLIFASSALQWARYSASRGRRTSTLEGMILAGIFTLGFLAGQLSVWHELISQGYAISGNPANSFFYLLTGLHGLHLIAGLIAWTLATGHTWRGLSQEETASKVELCAIYWHFLLFIWLVMFALLASSPEAFEAFAALCGLR